MIEDGARVSPRAPVVFHICRSFLTTVKHARHIRMLPLSWFVSLSISMRGDGGSKPPNGIIR